MINPCEEVDASEAPSAPSRIRLSVRGWLTRAFSFDAGLDDSRRQGIIESSLGRDQVVSSVE